MSVYYFKLVSGEEIITEAEKTEDSEVFLFINPMLMTFTPDPEGVTIMRIVPWILSYAFTESEFPIRSDRVMLAKEANQQIIEDYAEAMDQLVIEKEYFEQEKTQETELLKKRLH